LFASFRLRARLSRHNASAQSPLNTDRTTEARSAARNAATLLEETGSASLVVETIREPGLWLVVRDGSGRVLASTAGSGDLPDVDIGSDSYPAIHREQGYFATSLETGDSGRTIEAYAAGLIGEDDPFLRNLAVVQAVGLLIGLVVLVGLGPALATAALKPLRRVIDVAEDLRRGHLESRADLPELKSRNDEVGRVATSFDAMAESLEGLFEAERESRDGMRRFLADASHELRTPLTSVLGYLDVLEERGDADPAIRERSYAAMKEEGGRMVRLVEDLLTLARLESRQEMHAERVDLAALARGVAASFPGRRVEVRAAGPVVLAAEPDALRRVVSNLLSNATKHTPPEGEVEVSVERLDGEAVLRVSDSGAGIPEKDLPHIFERFYRSQTSRAGEGIGLGLAIVRETVEALEGRVEVESVAGEGSTFAVFLPFSEGS
jgi:two-component system OmpR family sensor kinase